MRKRKEINYIEILQQENNSYYVSADLAQTIWMLSQTTEAYSKAFQKVLAKAHIKISSSEWVALWIILSASGSATLTDVSRFLSITIQSVSQLLNKLEKRQLIRRVRSEDDKRVVKIFLTEKGGELLKEIIPFTYAFTRDTTGILSQSEIESLRKISRKLRNKYLEILGLHPSGSDIILDRLAKIISSTESPVNK